jgi:uncharacterized membrane protein affecting hemolysin expression
MNHKLALVCLAVVIFLMALANCYEANVITQQRNQIREMVKNPYCMGIQ